MFLFMTDISDMLSFLDFATLETAFITVCFTIRATDTLLVSEFIREQERLCVKSCDLSSLYILWRNNFSDSPEKHVWTAFCSIILKARVTFTLLESS